MDNIEKTITNSNNTCLHLADTMETIPSTGKCMDCKDMIFISASLVSGFDHKIFVKIILQILKK